MGGTSTLIDYLCKAGLWMPVDDGYAFHDWRVFQPARSTIGSTPPRGPGT